MSKSRIGSNPLDALISVDREPVIEAEAPTPKLQPSQKERLPKKTDKSRVTVLIADDVASRARDAVYWTPGETLASFAEKALEEAVKRAEKRRGEPFPKRDAELSTGRPVR